MARLFCLCLCVTACLAVEPEPSPDPVESEAKIAGDQISVIEAEVGKPMMLQCLAYGYPPPSVAWYKELGGPMVPYLSEQYEARGNSLLIREVNAETLGDYVCDAFNGFGDSALWLVTLRARSPENNFIEQELEETATARTTRRPPPRAPYFTTTPMLQPFEVEPNIEKVSTRVRADRTTVLAGSELDVQCQARGSPPPFVRWIKDGVRLNANGDQRLKLTDSLLRLVNARQEDSGMYGCFASNQYSEHESTIAITVRDSNVCQQVQERGPCLHYVLKWSYDESRDMCSQFWYGGCGGNGNNFETQEECEERCNKQSVPTSTTTTTPTSTTTTTTSTISPIIEPEGDKECRTPKSLEPCGRNISTFYYDSRTGLCTASNFGGCGYINSYRSEEACERTCGRYQGLEVCRYPLDPGPCRFPVNKFYWDNISGTCKSYAYGGCEGSPNRFSTIEECEEACKPIGPDSNVCQQVQERGPCLHYVVKWSYDESRDMCSQFWYGGCGGNENNFETQEECEERCNKQSVPTSTTTTTSTSTTTTTTSTISPIIEPEGDKECRTPKSLEPCGRNISTFYYDSRTGLCTAGNFGGCGYINSYRSEEACERTCGRYQGLEVCRYPLDPGPCRFPVNKFYWDNISGTCKSYAYGGCKGSPNRFSTIEECEETCKLIGPDSNVCQQVQERGPCSDYVLKWSYDESRDMCSQFWYGGCGGNGNNFETQEECKGRCKK